MNLQRVRKFFRDVRGANMVEYIILVGVVAVLAMAAFRVFGGSIKDKIAQQGNSVNGVNGTEGQ